MKTKLCALIVGIFIICPFASPVSGALIEYTDIAVLSAIVDNDPDYILNDADNVKNLFGGYEDEWFVFSHTADITFEKNTLRGEGTLTFEYLQPNTVFGATWGKVQSNTSFEVFSGDITLGIFGDNDIPSGKGKHFFGVRGDAGEIITKVIVNLDGARLRDPIHNAPVPEPTTILLLGSGLAGLVTFRKRFRRK
jgi:hypothetical protein